MTNRLVIERAIDFFARKALRTILFAYKDVSYADFERYNGDIESFESNLNVIALVGLMDPLKSSIT